MPGGWEGGKRHPRTGWWCNSRCTNEGFGFKTESTTERAK